MMEMILWAFLLVLVAANTAMTALVFIRLHSTVAEERLVREVDESMVRDRMDEGFENIMTFSVNGKTGFEAEIPDEE